MKTCQHCKHWVMGAQLAHGGSSLFNPDHAIRTGSGNVISLAPYEATHGDCLHGKNISEAMREWLEIADYDGDDGVKATASYDDSLGHFQTGRNFGCIHWEPKEA